MNPINVRPGVPWIDPPDPCFTGHAWSELVAAGLAYTQIGRKVTVNIPSTLEDRDEIIKNMKQLGFNGLVKFETQNINNKMLIVAVEVAP